MIDVTLVLIMYVIFGYSQKIDPDFDPADGIVIPAFYIENSPDYDKVTIRTPTGYGHDAFELKPDTGYELSDPLKEDILDYCLEYYGNRIVFLSEATNTYNCHGYAWHISEGGDNVCLEGNVPYVNKGSFTSYVDTFYLEHAKIAYPDTTDHSAIATDHQDTLISKWGNLPLFKHHIKDCPYNPDTLPALTYYWIAPPEISDSPDRLCT
ncbi:MAG: hypothetical protein ACP5D6_11155, partial [Kosmotogaceae bacterium]